MNPITLTFKNKDLEYRFNKEEEANLLDKILQIVIAFIITSIMGMYFWYSKGNIFFGTVSAFMVLYMVIIYYFMIYQRKFLQLITLVIGSMSLFCSTYQLLLVILKFDFPIEEQRILADGIMLAMFSFQLHNKFLLNSCQYVLFILFRIYISFNIEFGIAISLTLLFSAIIIHNDYVRIKTLRNRFLLKENNNNQLKILDNLDQYILVLEFQQQSQRLIEYFVNQAFKLKIGSIDTIEFVKNVFADRKNCLYKVVLQIIHYSTPSQQLQVKYEESTYQVNIQAYNGDRILVALEFIKVSKKDVLSNPYFYHSLLKYVKRHNKDKYRIEIMKNLCGFLLYQPQKLRLLIDFVSLFKIINLANPRVVEYNIQEGEKLRSNYQLIFLLFYLLKKCFTLDKLQIKKEQKQSEIYYKIQMIGTLNQRHLKTFEQLLNLLKVIINFVGLDDLTLTQSSISFTLINLEQKFLVI